MSAPEVTFQTEFERIIPNAYHGTDHPSAQSILKNGFRICCTPNTHLGNGAYFYESCLECAWGWTRIKKKIPPAVLRCTIRLGKCLDFTDFYFSRRVTEYYHQLTARLESKDYTRHKVRELTQTTVVNLVAKEWGADTVRAAIGVDSPIIPGGNILIDSRIVICVRNLDKISNTVPEPRPNTEKSDDPASQS